MHRSVMFESVITQWVVLLFHVRSYERSYVKSLCQNTDICGLMIMGIQMSEKSRKKGGSQISMGGSQNTQNRYNLRDRKWPKMASGACSPLLPSFQIPAKVTPKNAFLSTHPPPGGVPPGGTPPGVRIPGPPSPDPRPPPQDMVSHWCLNSLCGRLVTAWARFLEKFLTA